MAAGRARALAAGLAAEFLSRPGAAPVTLALPRGGELDADPSSGRASAARRCSAALLRLLARTLADGGEAVAGAARVAGGCAEGSWRGSTVGWAASLLGCRRDAELRRLAALAVAALCSTAAAAPGPGPPLAAVLQPPARTAGDEEAAAVAAAAAASAARATAPAGWVPAPVGPSVAAAAATRGRL